MLASSSFHQTWEQEKQLAHSPGKPVLLFLDGSPSAIFSSSPCLTSVMVSREAGGEGIRV